MTRRYNYEYTYLRIWGGVITDATATPADVKNGKIFYNNNGRQSGTNTNVKTLTTRTFNIDGNLSSVSVIPSSQCDYSYFNKAYVYSVSLSDTLNIDGNTQIKDISAHHTQLYPPDMSSIQSYGNEGSGDWAFRLKEYSGLNLTPFNIKYIQYSSYKYGISSLFYNESADVNICYIPEECGKFDSIEGICSGSIYPAFRIRNNTITGFVYIFIITSWYYIQHSSDITKIEVTNFSPVTLAYYV